MQAEINARSSRGKEATSTLVQNYMCLWKWRPDFSFQHQWTFSPPVPPHLKTSEFFALPLFSLHLHYADSQLTLLMAISVYTSNEIVFASGADDDIFNPWLGAWL